MGTFLTFLQLAHVMGCWWLSGFEILAHQITRQIIGQHHPGVHSISPELLLTGYGSPRSDPSSVILFWREQQGCSGHRFSNLAMENPHVFFRENICFCGKKLKRLPPARLENGRMQRIIFQAPPRTAPRGWKAAIHCKDASIWRDPSTVFL